MKLKVLLFVGLVLLGTSWVAPLAQADAPVDGRAGRAEMRFLEGMIDHHQMALAMATDCLTKADTESVITLCQAIIDAQSAEITLMQGWLLDWYGIAYTPMAVEDMLMMGEMEGMDHSAPDGTASDPTMMMGMMAGLNELTGIEYQIAWLEAMIDHHDDAIHMSERVLQRAEHEPLRTLAQAIITAQSAEIETMEALIAELSAE